MRIIFYLIVTCLSISSCNKSNSAAKQIVELNTTDTFRFDIPAKLKKDSSFLINNTKFNESLNLLSLENGFDSIQIRILYGGPMTGERFVILTNTDNKWNAEISKLIEVVKPGFRDSSNVYSEERNLLSRTSEYRSPNSGWSKFINKLFSLNILTLPDEHNIENFKEESFFDGVGVRVEVATKNVFRIYEYNEPDSYMNKHWQMKKICQILKLIDEEFELEKLWDYMGETPKSVLDNKPIEPKEMILQEVEPSKKKKRK